MVAILAVRFRQRPPNVIQSLNLSKNSSSAFILIIDADGIGDDLTFQCREWAIERQSDMSKGSRKLKIEIVVPVEAVDFIEAAGHQGRLNDYFSKMSERYQTSSFRIIERRGRGLRTPSRALNRLSSGKLSEYE